jgi:hypothetical protein
MNLKIETKPLDTCLEELKKEGFIKYFAINGNGLHEMNSDTYYKPGEFKASNFFKIKVEEDRTDDPILYAIETSDDMKGILSNTFKEIKDYKICSK